MVRGKGQYHRTFFDSLACGPLPPSKDKIRKTRKKEKNGEGKGSVPQDFFDSVACGPPSILTKKVQQKK